jgi:hypothetical protein
MTMTVCDICGADNVANTMFCDECGATLPAPSASARPQSAPLHEPMPVRPATSGLATAGDTTDGSSALDRRDGGTGDTGASARSDGERVAAPRAVEAATGASLMADEPGLAVAYLVSESGRRLDAPGQDVVIVGREDMRSGIRPDIDLTLDGASAAGVSRRHCRLLRGIDGWRVEDLMSTNYTVLNGKALPAHVPTLLHDGDELRLGKLRLRFHLA